MQTMNATSTEQVIYEMLTENTGSHLLDSGGYYGRAWERNQGKSLNDFISSPEMAFSVEYLDATKSVFHHLRERVSYDEDENAAFHAWAKDKDDAWLALMEQYLEELEANGEIEFNRTWTVNTYNGESILSQVLQYVYYEKDGEGYVLLQIHGGCDVRGGYTAPRAFKADIYELIAEDGYIYCTGEAVDSDGPHRIDWSGGEWTHQGEFSKEFSPYAMQERGKLLKLDYLPCPICGAPMKDGAQ